MTDSNQGPEMTDQPTLHDRLLTAMESVGRLEKEGTNTFHKYRYMSEEQVKVACQAACIKAQVMPSGIRIEIISDEWRKVGNAEQNLVKVRAIIMFGAVANACVAGQDGGGHIFEGIGSSADKGDKAYMQAQTGAIREAWKNCFIIPSGSDPEEKNPEDQPAEKRPAARREATPTEQAKGDGPRTGEQVNVIMGHLLRLGKSKLEGAEISKGVTGKTGSTLTVNDANKVIEHLEGLS